MAATESKTNDLLWDASVLSNKSWVEVMEEEERDEKINKESKFLRRDYLIDQDSSSTPYNEVNIKPEVKIEPEEDDVAQDVGVCSKSSRIPQVDGLPTFGKQLPSASLPKTPLKKESTEVFQEDISLTGHLDGFKLISPCKIDVKPQISSSKIESFKTPEKRLPCRQVIGHELTQSTGSCKRKLPNVKTDDSTLMPSPSKIYKVSTTTTISTPPNVVTRKRMRDNPTPTSKRSPAKKKREPETDPDILARRQKQIDYGKNTIGYERYSQLVPKESRTKIHPKTPPLHLKFSRRAWDGLVKVWRQRLHFWDPPSEGGGNPECLEIQSEISDCSSTDGSLPNTPVQDWKRQKSSIGFSPSVLTESNVKKLTNQISKRRLTQSNLGEDGVQKISSNSDISNPNSHEEESSEEFLSQGCTPLPD